MSENTGESERTLTPTEYFNKRNDKTVGEMFEERILLNPKWCIKMMQDYAAHIRGKLKANDGEKYSASKVRVNTIVSVPFTDMQLSIIAKAVEAFLVDDTIILDDDGNLYDELTITLKNDAQGIRYYLGLEDTKPDYFKE